MFCPKSKKCLKGSLVGGLILFVWMSISWMGIGWHQSYMKQLPNEEAVSQVLKSMVKEDGLYQVPFYNKGMDQNVLKAKMESGPVAQMLIYPNGKKCNMALSMLIGFLICCLIAGLVTSLLSFTTGLTLLQKVLFVVLVGLVGSIWHVLGNWNWWGYPCRYVLIVLVDLTIAWTLAGLGLAKFVVKD